MKLRYIWESMCKHVRCNQKLSLFGFARFKEVQNVAAKLRNLVTDDRFFKLSANFSHFSLNFS